MFIYFAFLFTTHSSSRQHAHHLAVVQGIRDDASYRGGLPHPSYSPAGPMGHGSISFPYLPASTSLALLPLCPGELPPLPAPQPSHTRTHPHPWEVIAPTLDAPGQSPKTTLPGAGVASLCARPISTCPHFPLPDKARSPSAAARARSCQVVHLPFVPKSPENDHIVIDPPPPPQCPRPNKPGPRLRGCRSVFRRPASAFRHRPGPALIAVATMVLISNCKQAWPGYARAV